MRRAGASWLEQRHAEVMWEAWPSQTRDEHRQLAFERPTCVDGERAVLAPVCRARGRPLVLDLEEQGVAGHQPHSLEAALRQARSGRAASALKGGG